MTTFDYFYGVTILQLVLRQTIYPKHFKSLLLLLVRQKKLLIWHYRQQDSLWSESEFELLWQKTVQQAEVLEILPRKRKRPAKLLNENEASPCDVVSDVKTIYRRFYFDDIDIMTNCTKTRLSQPGYRAIRNIEQLILNVRNGLEYQNQPEDVLSDYSKETNQ